MRMVETIPNKINASFRYWEYLVVAFYGQLKGILQVLANTPEQIVQLLFGFAEYYNIISVAVVVFNAFNLLYPVVEVG